MPSQVNIEQLTVPKFDFITRYFYFDVYDPLQVSKTGLKFFLPLRENLSLKKKKMSKISSSFLPESRLFSPLNYCLGLLFLVVYEKTGYAVRNQFKI